MRNFKKILVLMMMSIMAIGLVGCSSNAIKLNKAIRNKGETYDYEYTIKGIEEKNGYYVMAVDVKNNHKDQSVAIGIASIRKWFSDSSVDTTFALRNKKTGKVILYDNNSNYFGSQYSVVNEQTHELHKTVRIDGKETKTVYYPLIDIELYEKKYNENIQNIEELELVNMDEKKGEYIVID